MDDSRNDIPELPRPWGQSTDAPGGDPQPPTPPPPVAPSGSGGSAGCAKLGLFGCGCLGLGVIALIVLLAVFSERIVQRLLDYSERTITEALPADVPPEDRLRLERSFDGFSQAIREGQLDLGQLNAINTELANAMNRAGAGSLEASDVQRLLETFERVLDLGAGSAPSEASEDLEPIAWLQPLEPKWSTQTR